MVAGLSGPTHGRPPRSRTAIPTAFGYALGASLRTAVACSIRRRDHPSRPSASTGCFFSWLKTLLIPAMDHVPIASSTSRAPLWWPFLGVHRGARGASGGDAGLPAARVPRTRVARFTPSPSAPGRRQTLESKTARGTPIVTRKREQVTFNVASLLHSYTLATSGNWHTGFLPRIL